MLPPDDQAQGLRPPVTAQQTAKQILDYAEEHLSPEQLGALSVWLGLADTTVLGATSEEDFKKLVRSALAKLRREFADEA